MHLGQGESSHRSCCIKVGVLKNFTKIQVLSYEYSEILKTTTYGCFSCFLFLEKCLLPKPNFPSFRFLSVFSLSSLHEVLKRAFLDFLLYGYALLRSPIHFLQAARVRPLLSKLLVFQDFRSSKLLNVCSVLRQNKRNLSAFH